MSESNQRNHLTCCAVDCPKCGRAYTFDVYNATEEEAQAAVDKIKNCPLCGAEAKGVVITQDEARQMKMPADASGTPPKPTERKVPLSQQKMTGPPPRPQEIGRYEHDDPTG